jgi:carboxypeptidase Taq
VLSAYQQLETHYALIGKLAGANSLLFWDRNVVMRPGSAAGHADISGAMTEIITEKAADPRVGEWLSKAETQRGTLQPWQAANLTEMSRCYRHAASVPVALQVRKARHAAALNQTWQKARDENDFKRFAPGMQEMLAIQKEIAACKAQALGLSPYDALMDEHDPGMTCEIVNRVFTPLSRELPGILDAVIEKQASWQPLPLPARHSPELQRELCEALMRQIGYDFDCGRLDVTTHPFAIPMVPGDTRITTRFKEGDLRFALMATIHETGHSLYEYNLPRDWSFQPVGVARGATMHESQSLMLEMTACRSVEFIRFLSAEVAKRFGPDDPAYGYENFRQHYQRIWRNFIRIEADEVVYPLHVILRYEIERALLDGQLAVDELPGAWNAKMQELIGVTPPTDTLGCLQDVHWSFGMFAYFPNYAMGAATAAQLFAAAIKTDPGVLPALSTGNFQPYFNWVVPNVHRKASSQTFEQIVQEATGSPLAADALLDHLRRRYL